VQQQAAELCRRSRCSSRLQGKRMDLPWSTFL
jgi:hypothetical protein